MARREWLDPRGPLDIPTADPEKLGRRRLARSATFEGEVDLSDFRAVSKGPRLLQATLALLLIGIAAPALAQSTPSFGDGPNVACYIKDRAKPAMPGWTMLWKDTVARSKGCAEALPSCHAMLKQWGGADVCCTLQGGDKTIAGKDAASEACVEMKPPNYGSGRTWPATSRTG